MVKSLVEYWRIEREEWATIKDKGEKQMLFEWRDMVIEAFKNRDFKFFEKTEDSESNSDFEESIGERVKLRR